MSSYGWKKQTHSQDSEFQNPKKKKKKNPESLRVFTRYKNIQKCLPPPNSWMFCSDPRATTRWPRLPWRRASAREGAAQVATRWPRAGGGHWGGLMQADGPVSVEREGRMIGELVLFLLKAVVLGWRFFPGARTPSSLSSGFGLYPCPLCPFFQCHGDMVMMKTISCGNVP